MMNHEEILYDWISARERRLSGQRAISSFTCEFYESSEEDTGYQGVPRCRHSEAPTSEWCGPCQQRDRLWPGLQLLKKAERRAFAMLCRSALRFKKRHDSATSDPAGATLSETGATESAETSSSSSVTAERMQR
jgi:hypothetical protein